MRKANVDIKMRDLYVKIDDGEEFNLKFGAEVEVPVAVGNHTIYATNRMFKRQIEFEVAATGGVPSFEVANTARGCAGAFLALGYGPYQCELRRLDAAK